MFVNSSTLLLLLRHRSTNDDKKEPFQRKEGRKVSPFLSLLYGLPPHTCAFGQDDEIVLNDFVCQPVTKEVPRQVGCFLD